METVDGCRSHVVRSKVSLTHMMSQYVFPRDVMNATSLNDDEQQRKNKSEIR